MKMITSPNGWSCLPCSVAMALGVTLQDITDFLGHDGSEVWFPNHADPFRRRGFHTSEMMDYCVSIGKAMMIVPLLVRLHDPKSIDDPRDLYHNDGKRFERLMRYPDSVVLEPTHAVAWDGQEVYDPKGFIRRLETLKPQYVALFK